VNMLKRNELVLAIYLNRRGFAFVLFEAPLSPVDWGIARRDGDRRNAHCLKAIAALIRRYRPDVLVLQDTSWTGTRRSPRITNLNAAIFELAERDGIPVCAFLRERVRAAFSHLGSASKHAIAEAIVKHIPAFERYLPPPRKSWMAEGSRIGLFDAAALALTFFHSAAGEGQEAA
jgi:Holliday junction resolvasome RuvABC endonuclease subunit